MENLKHEKCPWCGSDSTVLYHSGTRDNEDIDVLKCLNCGLFFLDNRGASIAEVYEKSEMHKKTYYAEKNTYLDLSFDEWRHATYKDDNRRATLLTNKIQGKSVLDFGCENGGFLHKIKDNAKSVAGVEIENKARERLKTEGLMIFDDISNLDKFDVITMFHVIEHLENPVYWLKLMYEHLNEGGFLYIETPNGNDALLSLYECEAFKNFTFWSKHIYVYNTELLADIAKKAGFKIVENKTIQRYPLSNHLYWLSQSSPGGHIQWDWMNMPEINFFYEKVLQSRNLCDTLWLECER